MDSYGAPIDAVSADIKKVGGANAYVGMLRTGADGKRYKLVQSHDVSLSEAFMALGQWIVAVKGGQGSLKVTLGVDSSRCSGVTATPNQIIAGDYFWMQVAGRARLRVDSGATAPTSGSFVYCSGAGQAGKMTPVNAIDSDPTAIFTLNRIGVIGWALGDAASDLVDVDLDPGYQWSGSGAASFTTLEDS